MTQAINDKNNIYFVVFFSKYIPKNNFQRLYEKTVKNNKTDSYFDETKGEHVKKSKTMFIIHRKHLRTIL